MLTTKINKPTCCAICGHYLTTNAKYAGQRCLDPGHWQAVGLLASTDFYSMARLTAQASVELNRRFEAQRNGPAHRSDHRSVFQAEWKRSASQKQIGWLKIFGKRLAHCPTQLLARLGNLA